MISLFFVEFEPRRMIAKTLRPIIFSCSADSLKRKMFTDKIDSINLNPVAHSFKIFGRCIVTAPTMNFAKNSFFSKLSRDRSNFFNVHEMEASCFFGIKIDKKSKHINSRCLHPFVRSHSAWSANRAWPFMFHEMSSKIQIVFFAPIINWFTKIINPKFLQSRIIIKPDSVKIIFINKKRIKIFS